MGERSGLSKEQIEQYHKEGYLGPFDLFSESKAREYEKRIHEEVINTDASSSDDEAVDLHFRHRDSPAVYELCTRDQIVDQMTDIYGRNLLLWESTLWYKEPGYAEIPWHQHYHHLPIEPKVSISAWIALSECTEDNGCLQVIPGSHRKPYPQVDAPEEMAFSEMTEPEYVDEDRAISLEMEPGQYILFSECTLHRSFENTTDTWRKAVSARAVPPYVHIDEDEMGTSDTGGSTMLLSGENEYDVNELISPPEESA